MATLSITKTYADGTGFFETDLDNIRSALLTFVNTTKLNDGNIQASSIISEKIADGSITTSVITDNSATSTQIRIQDHYAPIGAVQMFHTYNGTVSLPRGWMVCNGDVVNSTNYNAIHGANQYTADGIASSAFDGVTLPNMTDKYAVGIGSTTTINSVGNADNEYNLQHTHSYPSHNHKWYNYNGTGSNATTWETVSGSHTEVSISYTTTTGNYDVLLAQSVASGTNDVPKEDLYTENLTHSAAVALSTAANLQPESIEVLFIIKVI